VPSERRQFGLLYRDFLFRMVDLELFSSHGDIGKLLGQGGALLAAFSFVMTVLMVPRYMTSRLPVEGLAVAAWGDEEFLISTTLAVAGLFAVVAWNAVLPDRRDAFVLGPLPVRIRTVFAAKVTAMISGLGVSILAVNVFTGMAFPTFGAGLRALAAYWTTMAAAGVFVFASLLALQGFAAHLLSYRRFLRISGVLQTVALFVILSCYFLTPSLATPHQLAAPENQRLFAWLPSFWFLGFFQELRGSTDAVFAPLAVQAVRNLSIASAFALSTYTLMYFRHMRRIVEEPDIAPADRARNRSAVAALAARCMAKPLDRAILLFTARTMARNRQQRFLLAAYAGAGFAISFSYVRQLTYSFGLGPLGRVTPQGLTVSLVLLLFTVVGARAVFALPVALRANWIFRLTAVHSPPAYFTAVRKSLLALAALPLWAVTAVIYLAIWPVRAAVGHLVVLAVAGVLLVDLSLHEFRKIPFTCSYLPGKANLKVKFGIYAGAFVFGLSIVAALEYVALRTPVRFLFFLAVALTVAWWAHRRWAEFAFLRHQSIQFEDLPVDGLVTLDLGSESGSAGEPLRIEAATSSGLKDSS